MSTLRDRILSNSTRKQRRVNVPGWGEVTVRELNAKQRTQFLGDVDMETGKMNLGALVPFLPTLVLDPESGKPLFELADLDTLTEDHPAAVQQLIMAALDVSDIGGAALDVAEGNS